MCISFIDRVRYDAPMRILPYVIKFFRLKIDGCSCHLPASVKHNSFSYYDLR